MRVHNDDQDDVIAQASNDAKYSTAVDEATSSLITRRDFYGGTNDASLLRTSGLFLLHSLSRSVHQLRTKVPECDSTMKYNLTW